MFIDGAIPPSQMLLQKCAVYVTKILRCFGVVEGSEAIGFTLGHPVHHREDTEKLVAPFVDAIVGFREAVRGCARTNAMDSAAMTQCCNDARDITLKALGVDVLDGAAGASWDAADAAVKSSAGARCSFFDRNLHSRMPLVPTPARLKLEQARDQWHFSRMFTFLPVHIVNRVQTLKVFIDAFLKFRGNVLALAAKGDAVMKDYLMCCDELRDVALIACGVKIGDAQQEGLDATWQMDDPQALQAEIDAKNAAKRAAGLAKVQKKLITKETELATIAITQAPISELFVNDKDSTGKPRWATELDEKGLPVRCAFSDRILHSRMPLDPTPLLRLKLCHGCDQWHFSRESTCSHRYHHKLCRNTEGERG
jgi:hypothetical protein